MGESAPYNREQHRWIRAQLDTDALEDACVEETHIPSMIVGDVPDFTLAERVTLQELAFKKFGNRLKFSWSTRDYDLDSKGHAERALELRGMEDLCWAVEVNPALQKFPYLRDRAVLYRLIQDIISTIREQREPRIKKKIHSIEETIDVAVAAKRLKVSDRSVRKWCKNMKIPCHRSEKIGNGWAIPAIDVDTHVRSRN